jgi:hypothetical protein
MSRPRAPYTWTFAPPFEPGLYLWCPELARQQDAIPVRVKADPFDGRGLLAVDDAMRRVFPSFPRGYTPVAQVGGWWTTNPIPLPPRREPHVSDPAPPAALPVRRRVSRRDLRNLRRGDAD